MNELPPRVSLGTIGELLVQLRLLELGIQAAPPVKDSGNDLIAILGREFRAVQVKTGLNRRPRVGRTRLPPRFHILALVHLTKKDGQYRFDGSKIYCLTKAECEERPERGCWERLLLTPARIAELFAPAV